MKIDLAINKQKLMTTLCGFGNLYIRIVCYCKSGLSNKLLAGLFYKKEDAQHGWKAQGKSLIR